MKRLLQIITGSLFAAAVVMEAYARIFLAAQFAPPSWLREHKYPFAVSHFGSPMYRSVAQRVEKVVGAEAITFPINSQGFRGRETAFAKPEGVVRIAMLGGSSVFDVSVSDFGDSASLVEERLRANGLKVEVLNFGMPGMPAYDCALRMMAEVARYQPDIVVLSTIWNDIAYFHTKAPLFRIPRPVRTAAILSYHGWLDELLSEHSYFYSEVRNSILARRLAKEFGGPMPMEDGSKGVLDAPTPEGMEIYRQGLRLFVDAARNAAATPILMTEHTLLKKEGGEPGWALSGPEHMGHFSRAGLLQSFSEANRVLSEVAAEKKVPLLNFGDQLNGRLENFVDHVHWKPAGRRHFVELLSARLESVLRKPLKR